MFGYVRYDLPNLFVKDVMLYKSLYCGLCKGIGAACGQAARMGLSYDVTFLSAILHNIAGQDIVIERSHCFEHCIRKRPIAAADDMTRALGALNTILVYYKLTDDVLDSGKGRSRRAWFRRGYRRAKKRYPELDAIVGGYIKKQAETERANTASPDAAADPSALMMQEIGDWFLKDKASEFTKGLFYGLGKWVYLIDALDDYEKDGKKKRYNPFVLSYGGGTRQELMQKYGEEISFLFDSLFYSLRVNLAGIPFRFDRDLTDNIILRGLPAETARVMKGEKRKKTKDKV